MLFYVYHAFFVLNNVSSLKLRPCYDLAASCFYNIKKGLQHLPQAFFYS